MHATSGHCVFRNTVEALIAERFKPVIVAFRRVAPDTDDAALPTALDRAAAAGCGAEPEAVDEDG